MKWRWGARQPADPERAERNRETVRHLVLRHDPVLVQAAGRELGQAERAPRERQPRAARSRS